MSCLPPGGLNRIIRVIIGVEILRTTNHGGISQKISGAPKDFGRAADIYSEGHGGRGNRKGHLQITEEAGWQIFKTMSLRR